MKRFLVFFLLAALCILPLTANGQGEDDGQIRIGATIQWLNDTYFRIVTKAMEERAAELGVKLILLDGEGKAEKQVSQVENLIAQDVDVIIIAPTSMEGCAPAVEKANKAGIPIFTLTNMIKNQDECVTFVGSDAPESGRIQGEMIVNDTGGAGNVALLMGIIGHDAQIGRKNGLLEAFEGTDLSVIVEQTGNWQRDQALQLMESWLQAGQDITVVAAQNDNMAMGALKAVENAGLQDKIKVYGIDATADALSAIEEGRLMGTVFQDAIGQGRMAIDAAIKIVNGEPVEDPLFIPYLPVTSENLGEFK